MTSSILSPPAAIGAAGLDVHSPRVSTVGVRREEEEEGSLLSSPLSSLLFCARPARFIDAKLDNGGCFGAPLCVGKGTKCPVVCEATTTTKEGRCVWGGVPLVVRARAEAKRGQREGGCVCRPSARGGLGERAPRCVVEVAVGEGEEEEEVSSSSSLSARAASAAALVWRRSAFRFAFHV